MKKHAWVALGFATFFAACTLSAGAIELNHTAISARVLKETRKAFGPDAADRVAAWSDLVMNNKDKSTAEKLALTNGFFNRIPTKPEKELWDHPHWSTPFEMLTRNVGSQADHVIAKYVTLEALGIGVDQMKITHVHSMKSSDLSYMVLTYQSKSGVMPLVLDTVGDEIKPANERNDLFPEHSLNDNGLWLAREQKDGLNDAKEEAYAHVELWNEMNGRLDDEMLSADDPSGVR